MGAHHGDLHPDGVHIYVGSAEGHTFVVNKDTMTVVAEIETGPATGTPISFQNAVSRLVSITMIHLSR